MDSYESLHESPHALAMGAGEFVGKRHMLGWSPRATRNLGHLPLLAPASLAGERWLQASSSST